MLPQETGRRTVAESPGQSEAGRHCRAQRGRTAGRRGGRPVRTSACLRASASTTSATPGTPSSPRAGGTLKDAMVRAGQSSEKAALIHQHSTLERQKEVAAARDARVRAERLDRPTARQVVVLDVNDVLDEGQAIGALDGLTQPERPGGNADGLQEAAALGVRGGGRKGVAGRVTRRSSPKMSTSSLRVTSKSTADAGGAAMDLGPSPSVCPIQTNGPWLGRVGSRFRADRSANARRTPEPRDSSRVCPAGR